MNATWNLSSEQYLKELSGGLRTLPPDDRTAIVEEIGSHIADRTAEGQAVERTLTSLGAPTVLARSYIDDHQLAHALDRPSPLRLLATILSRATSNVAALAAGFAALALYGMTLSFVALAILKPIIPRYVGFWTSPHGFSFGIYPPPSGATERLGYWIIPISVMCAMACYFIATALIRICGRWLLRRAGATERP